MQGIYAIVNLVNGRRYIGSSVNVSVRWGQHRSALARGAHLNAHLQRAWRKYGPEAFQFVLLEPVADRDALVEREQAQIDATPMPYNIGPAGTAMRGRRHTADAIEKMRAAALRRPPLSQESRAQIAAALRGRTTSPEVRAKLSALRRGKPGRPLSEATKAKLRALKVGTTASAATKAKMSAALRGRPHSAQWTERIRDARARQVFSDESRARMSIAAKRRWARTDVGTIAFRNQMRDAANQRWHSPVTGG